MKVRIKLVKKAKVDYTSPLILIFFSLGIGLNRNENLEIRFAKSTNIM